MSDNVGYTPGSGATVAADNVGGVLYQRVKLALGADGVASDVSATNPLPVEGEGELIEVLQRIRDGINLLVNTIGSVYPDINSRLRVVADSGNFNVNSLTAVGTLTDITTVSGWNYQRPYEGMILPTLIMAADTVTANIVVS